MNKGVKDMYYIARRNMYKYILFNGEYYPIVGFTYFKDDYGLIIIDNKSIRSSTINDLHKWYGINHLFLSRKKQISNLYGWFHYPLSKNVKIIDNKL